MSSTLYLSKHILYFVCIATFTSFVASSVHADYRERDLPNGWKEVFPGGETICARGEPFSFFYREGSPDDVVIDFVGGGACWSYGTCNKDTPTFVDSVDYVKDRIAERGLHGIYDQTNDTNPIKDWTHVVIPYCTGDLHWGDNTKTYSGVFSEVTIFHKGAVNAKAVIDWARRNYSPERMLVTGTSAGGYGSVYWLPYIKEQNPRASLTQFSDGAAGVMVKNAYRKALEAWQIERNAPAWIPNLDPRRSSWIDLTIADLYIEIGRYYPTTVFSQFNTLSDRVQTFFYFLMGGNVIEWSSQALEYMDRISDTIENFHYFHAAGDAHTVLPETDFYSIAAENVKLVDWMQNMIDQANLGNVVCSECELVSTLSAE